MQLRNWKLHQASLTNAIRQLTVVFVLSTMAGTAWAEGENETVPADRASTEAKDSAPKCVHGCERWGKACNVDPRGVYKCRRRCEKFGEICE